tara:strand:+ start:5648 stop:5824 length:177 start_codon:yes stop_codon:yes gene_type:complete
MEEEIKCPTCGSTDLEKIPLTGLLLQEIECRCLNHNCGLNFTYILKDSPNKILTQRKK